MNLFLGMPLVLYDVPAVRGDWLILAEPDCIMLWLWRWLDITERYGDSLTCPGSRCSGAEKLLGECIFLRMEVIRCWAFSSSLILASSLLGIAVFSYLFSSRLWVRKFYVMIREISLKLSKTARRGFLTFLSGGQNRLNSLSVFKVHSGIARL